MKREALTPQTVTDPKRLLAAIVADRARGYSLVDREAEPHFRSIAVPVKRYDGTIVAAINIGAHVDRISTDEMVKRFLPLLREQAAQASHESWSDGREGEFAPKGPQRSSDLLEFATKGSDRMANLGPERRLAAVVAADMVGYSRLMEVDEAGTLVRLKTHRIELIDPAIAKNRGRIIKTTGDGILVEFQSVVDAVVCAAEIQRRMMRRNADVPQARWIQFRIGINLGDVIVDEDDIFGDGVNIAARLERLAEPGGICVSAAVCDQVGDRLEDIVFEDLGDQQVKNIARPIRVFRIRLDQNASVAPEAREECRGCDRIREEAVHCRAAARQYER